MKLLRKVLRRTSIYPAYKTLGHYPDYWYWNLRGRPPRPPHLLKQRTVRQTAVEFGLRVLVETGTYYGEMVAAVKKNFRKVYSIELDPRLAELARKRFRGHPHVHILEGSSQSQVPDLLKQLERPALFWLDAGYFAWDGTFADTSRLDFELSAIFADTIPEHVVLIDDVVPFAGRDGLPELADIEAKIKQEFPERVVSIQSGILRIAPPMA